jgi:hypothetical protein
METQSQRPIIPEGYEDLLETTALAHAARIGPPGEPQGNPVWFDWDGKQLILPVGTRRKNLNRDRASPPLSSTGEPLRLPGDPGEVIRIEEDPNIDFISAAAKRYLGLDRHPYHQPGDERVVIFVRPEHTTQMGR